MLSHFAQAKDTPVVAGTLGQQLHPFEQNNFSESILHGTVGLSNLNLSATIHACIQEMCFPPGEDGSDPVGDVISPKYFSNRFKQLSEDLSSPPSGHHIEHNKAELEVLELCTIYATILSLPFKHGCTLHRWTSAVQVMLEKTKGCAWIDKLRFIQLLEEDLSMAFRIIFGCCPIHRAEDHGTIPMSQLGSWPNRSSTDAILLKCLSYDGLSLLRYSAIIFNNDYKTAFDCMVPSIGGIALCCLGDSSTAVSTLLQTLQQMKYKVWTLLGVSETSFPMKMIVSWGYCRDLEPTMSLACNHVCPPWCTEKTVAGHNISESTGYSWVQPDWRGLCGWHRTVAHNARQGHHTTCYWDAGYCTALGTITLYYQRCLGIGKVLLCCYWLEFYQGWVHPLSTFRDEHFSIFDIWQQLSSYHTNCTELLIRGLTQSGCLAGTRW